MPDEYTNSNGNGNGNGKKKVFDVRDLQHWGVLLSAAQFVAIILAAFFFADMRNAWINHQDTDRRHWAMSWTLPEMIDWANSAAKKLNSELPDPYETTQRFKDIKSN